MSDLCVCVLMCVCVCVCVCVVDVGSATDTLAASYLLHPVLLTFREIAFWAGQDESLSGW